MEETTTLIDRREIMNLIDSQRDRAVKLAGEVVEKELEMFEFKLFVSSIGREKLNRIGKEVEEVKNMDRTGKINLAKYEEFVDEI